MSSTDRTSFMMVALGMMLATACGGEPLASDEDHREADGHIADAVEDDGVADDVRTGEDAVVEKANGVLSGSPTFINFGTLAATETKSEIWVISATERAELVTAVSVPPFTVSPIGCPLIDPDDPTIRRCVFTITFTPPGNAGTFEATLGASDLEGNITTIDVVGVGEAFIP